MTIEDLKNKLKKIFENVEYTFDENTTQSLEPTSIDTKEFVAKDNIKYIISKENGNIVIKDASGNIKDISSFDQEDQNKINILFPPEVAPSTPETNNVVTQSDIVTPEPETVVAEEENINEVNSEVAAKFEAQYGPDWKKYYYATANAQGRNPETFKK